MEDIPICECATFWETHHDECPVRREVESLRAELAACQQDAERYRRLCSLVAWGNFGVCRVQSNEEGDDYADDGDMLDAWLDDPEMIAEAQAIDAYAQWNTRATPSEEPK